jgi:hypothetical protein
METTPGGLRLELFPMPEPDEVVTMFLQEFKVDIVVKLLRSFGAVRAGTHAIMEVVPDV